MASSSDVVEGKLLVASAEGKSLLLTRIEGRVVAVENKCSHLGWSMAKGKLEGTTLQCPWHGSKFDVCSGKNLDWVNSFAGVPTPRWSHKLIALGKAPAPIKSYEVQEKDGQVLIALPD